MREVVARYTPEEAERVTGVSAEAIRATAREYATERHAAIFYTLGITEHACGVDNIWSLANLVLMTGHLGYESTGLNALRGQNNVQGLNDSGANPHYLPGYQPWDDPDVREKFAKAWNVDLPERAGYRLDQMMSGLHDGRIKALYLIGENPAQTEPNAAHVEEGLSKLEFVVAQDLFLNETSATTRERRLPGVELRREGRHVHEYRAASEPRARSHSVPGNARGDREIVISLARALGCDWPEYPDAESVWKSSPTSRRTGSGSATTGSSRTGCSGRAHRATIRERSSCTRATPRFRPARGSSIPSSTSRRSRSPTPSILSCCQPGERCTTTTRGR